MEGYMKFSDDITKCRCYGDRMRRVCSKTLNIGSNSFVFKEAFTTFFTELQCIRKGQQDPTDALSQNITQHLPYHCVMSQWKVTGSRAWLHCARTGLSLNDVMLHGSDLPGWRASKVWFASCRSGGRQMCLRQFTLRFALWSNGDRTEDPVDHLFGSTFGPNIADVCLERVAKHFLDHEFDSEQGSLGAQRRSAWITVWFGFPMM